MVLTARVRVHHCAPLSQLSHRCSAPCLYKGWAKAKYAITAVSNRISCWMNEI